MLGRAVRWSTLFAAWMLCAPACEVYDTALLGGFRGLSDSGASEPRDSGFEDDARMGDADTDGGAVTACVSQPDDECPQRCPETCNGEDDDCDGLSDEGTLAGLCKLPRSTSVCTHGGCLIASCDKGYVDCDELAANGCEAQLGSTEHCGVCGHHCELAHAEPTCKDARCVVRTCETGFGDCDQRADNGCERPLSTLSDCGKCGSTCSLAHATTDCAAGSCSFASCQAGYGDCNGDADKLGAGDGCETDLSKPTACGECGKQCPAEAPYCTGGKCTSLSCPAEQADCDANNVECETSLRTVDNCGGCGVSCGSPANATVSCSTGSCVPTCNAGFTSCDDSSANGCETDVRTNTNCGACGQTCTYANAAASCSAGTCQLTGCNGGFGDCNANTVDGCEQRLNTNTHCGGCGKACSLGNATASCSSGSCQVATCNAGFGNCDGSAANGCEVDLTSDAKNCNACGQACPSNFSCQSGRCVCTSNSNCPSGQSCCGGSCKNLASDADNCGSCGNDCGTGSCCGGSCKNLATDMNNCGSCGRQCDANDTNRCTSGQCRCASDAPCSGIFKCCSSGCKLTLICL